MGTYFLPTIGYFCTEAARCAAGVYRNHCFDATAAQIIKYFFYFACDVVINFLCILRWWQTKSMMESDVWIQQYILLFLLEISKKLWENTPIHSNSSWRQKTIARATKFAPIFQQQRTRCLYFLFIVWLTRWYAPERSRILASGGRHSSYCLLCTFGCTNISYGKNKILTSQATNAYTNYVTFSDMPLKTSVRSDFCCQVYAPCKYAISQTN